MTSKSSSTINVHYYTGAEKLFVGQLGITNRKIFFEYEPKFINTGLELSPFKLPLKAGIQKSEEFVFNGLFGVFNDSLPDGWGHILLDRKLMSVGINPGDLSALDRLKYVGNNGMGALAYEPEIENVELSNHATLDALASEIVQFQEHDDVTHVDELLALNGSSAGARPKVILKINDEDWIIKFRSVVDLKDIGPIEYAYHLMAKKAGLIVPDARIYQSKIGPGYFGVKRFDKVEGNNIHMHTISGLLHVDHRLANLDYETIMKTTLFLTKDARECKKQFRAAVFNVFSHNRDDHAKNFSFLMDNEGKWEVSPSYDLTFSSGPAGEHCSMVMGEGKKPTLEHLMRLAEIGDIKKEDVLEIIDEVQEAVSKWEEFATMAQVSKASKKLIQNKLNDIA